jgi:hypothetical protein
MEGHVRVESVDALKDFRAAMCKFAESSEVALGEAEADMQRTLAWLKGEQITSLRATVNKLIERVNEAKARLREKKMFRMVDGSEPNTDEEEKQLKLAVQRLEEAERKLQNTRQWITVLSRELILYRGQVQAMYATIDTDVPNALANLDKMTAALETYLATAAPIIARAPVTSASGESTGIDVPDSVTSASRGGELRPAPEKPIGTTLGASSLRAMTPDSESRDGLSIDDSFPDGEVGRPLNQESTNALREVDCDRQWPNRSDMVVLARDCLSESNIYLERCAVTGGEDSGWYIAPASGPAAEKHDAYRISDLLRRRPDLNDVLKLPVGSLVIIDSASIIGLFNSDDKDLWPKPA